MSLDYARDHLAAAVRSLATREDPLSERVQAVWDGDVPMLWEKPCLTVDLLGEFRDVWRRYTAPSDDRQATALRELSPAELVAVVDDLMSPLLGTTVAAARSGEDVRLATLADLA